MGNDISQKISEYSKKISELENEYRLSRTEFEKMETLYFKIFDGYIHYRITASSGEYEVNRDSVFKINPPLINEDPKQMKEFTGLVKFETGIYKMQNKRHHLPLLQAAVELILLLKKEYHLE